ncbi:hypothetical protein [Pseudoalteromonas sp. S16_S37]|uniref:hypothetical protein n=1 Tax=Pseudoalteromonas sp. S16_S37 TaxID=2720228 RepID=UPI001680F163|nr:hypothetical protein [Pseudoalteromonas sp. S16_S37]MBD1583101.1 hypothetical protein [Pseudoalteromonas sp. S16_S37]
MHTYNEADTHELILEHQHRSQLYATAKANVQTVSTHNEYDRKRYLDGLFVHTVLAQLGSAKAELANHGYGSEIVTKTEQIEDNGVVVDVIYEVAFKFSGNLQSDTPVVSDDSQLVFFTQSGSNYIACRYKTAQLTSQVQVLYFDDEGYSHFRTHGTSNMQWHAFTHSQSELACVINDFISLIFIQKRANLSRI